MAVEGVDMAKVLLGGRGPGVETLLLSPGERDGRRYITPAARPLVSTTGGCAVAMQSARLPCAVVAGSRRCCRCRTQSQPVVEGVWACRGRVVRRLLAGQRAGRGSWMQATLAGLALKNAVLFSCQSG